MEMNTGVPVNLQEYWNILITGTLSQLLARQEKRVKTAVFLLITISLTSPKWLESVLVPNALLIQ